DDLQAGARGEFERALFHASKVRQAAHHGVRNQKPPLAASVLNNTAGLDGCASAALKLHPTQITVRRTSAGDPRVRSALLKPHAAGMIRVQGSVYRLTQLFKISLDLRYQTDQLAVGRIRISVNVITVDL